MENKLATVISVQILIHSTIEKVWASWTNPICIQKWNTASDDWHTPTAKNDLTIGGKFNYRMEAKNGSFGFDFWGIYDEVILHKTIAFTLGDSRKVRVLFEETSEGVTVTEIFEAESQNPIELQQQGWQAILNNFKIYTEYNL